ncbi:VOC family protein [Novosphingobium sp. 1949]|uniref:VOC family protein n=1 Tax=Novosphingobium organovorum TaxID=2930092 RepID=A0ABT0B9U6_9SPHN|nr:VOC family protein [Novosphingobium organovorum]MCJ2181819.1 VOC family protein [Novosphingobium organovorum]
MNSPFLHFETRVRARVVALDHFCVVVADLDRAEAFYCDVLSLESYPAPAPLTRETARWIYDHDERPIIHLNTREAPRAMDRDMARGPTGALHHIALRCEGYDEIRDRLEDHGLVYESNFIRSIGLRQLFVHDPDGVLLELNFFED